MKLDTSTYYPKSPLDDDDPVSADMAGEVRTPDAVEERVDPEVSGENPEPDMPESEGEEIVTRLSTLLSWVLVPLLMPVFGTLLAFGYSLLKFTPLGVKTAFVLIVTAFCVVAPSLCMMALKRFGVIHDIGLNTRSERPIPYAICVLALVGTAIFMWYKGAPMWFVMFFAGGAAAGVIELIINHWWKISVHAAGIAGICALLLRIMLDGGYPGEGVRVWFMVSVGLAGLLGSARIWLGRHTLGQVLAGYVVGFCTVFFMTLIR